MTLAETLAARRGGSPGRWASWLRQRGLPPDQPLAALGAGQRARLDAALAGGPAASPSSATATRDEPPLTAWARRAVLAWLDRHRPDEGGRWAAGAPHGGDDPTAPPLDAADLQATAAAGAGAAAVAVFGLLRAADRAPPLRDILAALAWTGVPRAVDLRLAVQIALPRAVGRPALPTALFEVVAAGPVDAIRLRGGGVPSPAAVRPLPPPAAQQAGLFQRLAPLPADLIGPVWPAAVDVAIDDLVLRWRFRASLRPPGHGSGVVALFAGPHGHGRRTAARTVAARLGLELWRVQSALLGSKWVGETEARTSQLFHAAAQAGAALLFDDANDLLDRHVEVHSAGDRYANAARAHLLQEIERFDGLAILVAQGMHQFGEAMRRRIHVAVRFDPPDRAQRARILAAAWRWLQARDPALCPPREPDWAALAAIAAPPQAIVRAVLDAGMAAARGGGPVDDDALWAALSPRGEVTVLQHPPATPPIVVDFG